jgi:hypothetical protein
MNNMHEAPLLDVVRRRIEADSIYTYTGNVLVSLNPYKGIPGLYDEPLRFLELDPSAKIENGVIVYAKKATPHVYAIASEALRALDETAVMVSQEVSSEVNNSTFFSSAIYCGLTVCLSSSFQENYLRTRALLLLVRVALARRRRPSM